MEWVILKSLYRLLFVLPNIDDKLLLTNISTIIITWLRRSS